MVALQLCTFFFFYVKPFIQLEYISGVIFKIRSYTVLRLTEFLVTDKMIGWNLVAFSISKHCLSETRCWNQASNHRVKAGRTLLRNKQFTATTA